MALARRIRSAPDLGATRVVLASAPPGAKLSNDDAALFDVTPWSAAPWRRLLDVLAEMLRENGSSPGAAAGADPSAGKAKADDAEAIPDLAGCRILIAEDVATNQVLLRAMLRPTVAEVEIFADGAALLDRHRAALADLILMDLQLPGMGGLAAIRHLRKLDGAAGAVPVIALTAYARRADRKRALDAGTDAYMTKPVVVPEFYALLRRLLPDCAGAGD